MNRPEDWTRLQRIQYLLDQWDTIFDVNATSSIGGGELGIALLPAMANHPSVRELDRCLQALQAYAPIQYQHVKAYRCAAEWRTVPAKTKIQLPSGRWEQIDSFKAVRVQKPWVRLEKVRRGEQFLADTFQGQVFIPDDLWESAHRYELAA